MAAGLVKILLTGMTPAQHDTPLRRIKMVNVTVHALVPALRELGHDVTWKPVAIDDPPEHDYDLAIVGVAPLGSIQVKRKLGAFTVLDWGLPTLMLVDDWRMYEIFSHIRSARRKGAVPYFTRKHGDGTYYDVPADPHYRDKLVEQAPRLMRIAEQLQAGPWPKTWSMLLPMHRFGNPKLAVDMLKAPWLDLGRVATFDPSAFVEVRPSQVALRKERKWALATVQHYEWWIVKSNFGWPVDYYGIRGTDTPVLKDEDAVFDTYSSYWGVLSPPHQHAGSGWYRMRYLHAALGGSVLYLDPRDQRMFPVESAYRVGTPADVERLSDDSLAALARAQGREYVDHWFPSRARELANVDRVLSAAARCAAFGTSSVLHRARLAEWAGGAA